jgi:phosphoglycolate phosphatase
MIPKYIVFDFDGTLVDSKATFIATYNQLAQKNSFKLLTLPDIEVLRKLSVKERCRFLEVPLYRLPFLATEFLRQYQKSIGQVLLVPGMAEVLQQLKLRGYALAIISSNAEANIRQFLQHNELDFIPAIYCSRDLFGKDKLIKKFLRKYRLQPPEIIYIGDEHRDVVACQKSNVKIIWASWGYEGLPLPQNLQPDYVATSPNQILDYINQ